MSISFSGIKPGSDESSKNDKGIVTSSLVWRFKSNDPADTSYDVGSHGFCPRIGTPHPEDANNWCVGLSITNPDPYAGWEVAASYSTEREVLEDPLAEPAIIGPWDTENYQEPAVVNNADELILNSAGDMFDPPVMKDFNRRGVSVSKNVASVPVWFLDYEDAVNSDVFSVGGLSVAVGCGKLSRTTISERKNRNGTDYYVVGMYIQLAKKSWTRKTLDAGFHQTVGGVRSVIMIGAAGDELPVTPVPLDGAGGVLANPSPSTSYYRSDNIEDRLPFSALPLT